jgi:hypothetical protein
MTEDAGWRSCIDHIIRPDSPCPVCRITELTAQLEAVKALNDDILRGIARGEHYAPDRREIYDRLATALQERGSEKDSIDTSDNPTDGQSPDG